MYFSRPVETNFLTATEAADDSSNEFGLVSGAILDSAVSEERIYAHVANILTAGANVEITPDDTDNTLTIAGSAAGGGSDIAIQEDGTELEAAVSLMNFTGDGVTVTADSANGVEIEITGEPSDIQQRAEQLVFAAITTAVTQTNDELATLSATGFAGVSYPDGATTLEMLSATASETTATILKCGYLCNRFCSRRGCRWGQSISRPRYLRKLSGHWHRQSVGVYDNRIHSGRRN